MYGPGKTPEQCAAIVAELLDAGAAPVLLTRASSAQAAAARRRTPAANGDGTTVVWRPARRDPNGSSW